MSTNEKLAPGYGDAWPPEPTEHDEYAAITDTLNADDFSFFSEFVEFFISASETELAGVCIEIKHAFSRGDMHVTYELFAKYLDGKK